MTKQARKPFVMILMVLLLSLTMVPAMAFGASACIVDNLNVIDIQVEDHIGEEQFGVAPGENLTVYAQPGQILLVNGVEVGQGATVTLPDGAGTVTQEEDAQGAPCFRITDIQKDLTLNTRTTFTISLVKKVVNTGNGALPDATFAFQALPPATDGDLAYTYDGNTVQTEGMDGAFEGNLRFTFDGHFDHTALAGGLVLTEVNDGQTGWTYAAESYYLEPNWRTVNGGVPGFDAYDLTQWSMEEIYAGKASPMNDDAQLVFTNSYAEPAVPSTAGSPKTADPASPAMMVMLLAGSLLTGAGVVLLRREK